MNVIDDMNLDKLLYFECVRCGFEIDPCEVDIRKYNFCPECGEPIEHKRYEPIDEKENSQSDAKPFEFNISTDLKLGSLFDGSGTAPLAAAMCGIEPVWASEIEPYPIKVTKARFPNMLHLGDITKINGAEVEPVDIICGGSPCQDLSVAGKQKGLQDGERSHLFFEMTRIIKQMREATNGKYPRYIIWENVPGAFSSNKGRDFHAVLQAFAEIADPNVHVPRPPRKGKSDRLDWRYAGSIVADGYSIAWRTVDAQYWGVPQRRRRIYMVVSYGGVSGEDCGIDSVADLTGECAGEVLFERTGMSGHHEQGGTQGQEAAGDAGGSTDGSCGVRCLNPWDIQSNRLCTVDGVFQTLDSHMGGGGGDYKGIVCLNDQGGNVMSVSYDCTATLRAQEHGHQPVVAGFVGRQGAKSGSVGFEEGISPTLRQGITTDCVYALQGNGIDRADTAGCNGKGWRENECYTLNTIDRPAVAFELQLASGKSTIGTLMANASTKLWLGNQEAFSKDYHILVPTDRKYIVRRLTPLECCRLQGFPDWWEDGVEGSDSARYRMWGNGMSLPNMLHVMKGITRVEQESKRCLT